MLTTDRINRNQKIDEAAAIVLKERMSENIAAIYKEYLDNQKQLQGDFLKAVDEAFWAAIELQEKGEKGKASYFCISYLVSCVFSGRGAFRLDVYDDMFYADIESASAYWYPDFIFRYFKQDIPYALEAIKASDMRIGLREYELDGFKKRYLSNYFHIAKKYCMDQIKSVNELQSYQKMKKGESFRILFGGYLDQAALIAEFKEALL